MVVHGGSPMPVEFTGSLKERVRFVVLLSSRLRPLSCPPARLWPLLSLTVLWKLVEKIVMPKPKRPTLVENKSSAPAKGMNWSFAAGTNLFPGLTAKIDRESKQKLNEFAKEIRSFSIVDMSGCNFGDDGLFFLAESLAYNQLLSDSRGSEFCCKWNNCRRNKSL
uniref:Uncharacterized protein n=1 Tax=Manihot esculenta TaxID=3983 RepID=A0A2C9VX35_MANES